MHILCIHAYAYMHTHTYIYTQTRMLTDLYGEGIPQCGRVTVVVVVFVLMVVMALRCFPGFET